MDWRHRPAANCPADRLDAYCLSCGSEATANWMRVWPPMGHRILVITSALTALSPGVAEAYIGPGAGFAFLTSFLVLFTTILLAFLSLLIWPFRTAWRMITRRKRPIPRIKRLIIVGFDGQDPKLTDRFLKQDKLPNFKALANKGCYRKLRTTFPSVSPVAWSSFSTGSHPARHNIFDFLDRDRRTYLPVLSSTHIGKLERSLKLGPYRVPLHKPEIRLLRKSKPFWTILGEHNIWSTVLRVPITFPPDHFYGAQLSAMCVPDLLGTQGTFLLFTTRPESERFKEGGIRIPVSIECNQIEAAIPGPENTLRDGTPPLTLPLRVTIESSDVSDGKSGDKTKVHVQIGDESVMLEPGVLSGWVDLRFKAVPGITVRGITRMMVTEAEEHFSLYMTPIALDPDKPAMPISHPDYYAIYLSKKIGKYSTLGLAEDTWALNEGVIDDDTFLQLTYDIDAERWKQFDVALEKLRTGALVCVFDATDRIQHMFWRYLEKGHPADNHNGEKTQQSGRHEARDAIEQLYMHNDRKLGELLQKIDKDDLLMVISDHGFSSFRRGVNLNRWLHDNGYLTLKPNADGSAEWLLDVDWSQTKAYCLGLTGMFLNLQGRESEGIVAPGSEATTLKAEIIAALAGLRDDERDEVAIVEAFDTEQLYNGPYSGNAPDLLIGYNAGYRTSWDCATGMVDTLMFEDNVKAWSGDHCIDPRLVPGVIFCNRKIDVDDPALIDLAPTALAEFGVKPPGFMDGKPLFKSPNSAAGTSRS